MAGRKKRPAAFSDPPVRMRRWLGIAAAVLILAFLVLELCGLTDRLLVSLGLREEVLPLPADGVMQVHFLDVGNADATLILCDGHAALIDAGEREDGDAVVRYLRRCGVTKLDYLIASHADVDHIGGMGAVLDRFAVGRCLMSYMPQGFEPNTSTYLHLLEKLEDCAVPVTDVRPGEEYPLGQAMITVLGPVTGASERNNQSIVCRVQHGGCRYLFTGDAEVEEEQSLLDYGADLRADLLKVAHHGSHSSSAAPFLREVGAKFAVIPCGADNEYDHPHADTLARLQALGAAVWRTDEDGTVVACDDGKQITVQPERSR